MPKVSVIIPSYNSAHLVNEAIDSVLAQSYESFEIIVVDDGSQDDTRAMIEGITDPRVRYIYQDNEGLAGARNTGIKHARGQYVAFLDADDLFLPDKLEQQVQILEEQPEVGVVGGGFIYIDQTGQPLAERKPWRYRPRLDLAGWLSSCPFIVHAVLIRRDWLGRAGGFDPSLRRVEDWDLWLRLAYLGCRMAWAPHIVCAYRMHTGQMTRDGQSQKETTLAVLDKFFTQPDLPIEAHQQRTLAYTEAYLAGAFREYGANQIDAARQSLAKAIALSPPLTEGDRPPLVDALIAWAVDPGTGDPITYLDTVLSNLPPAAASLNAMNRQIYGITALRSALDANLVGNTILAQHYLSTVVEKKGKLFDTPDQFVRNIVDLVRDVETQRQAEAAELLFDNLPANCANLGQLRRKTIGRLYAVRAFEQYSAGDMSKARPLLLHSIFKDPTWLQNRGVWSILFRSIWKNKPLPNDSFRNVTSHGSE